MTASRYPVFPRRLAFLLALTLLFIGAAAGPTPAQTPQRAVARLGDFGLSLALVGEHIWLVEISADPARADQPFDLSIMVDPSTRPRVPDGGGNQWTTETTVARVSQNPPALTISRRNGDQDGEAVFTLSPYAPDGQLAGVSFSGQYSHLFGLGADYRLANNDVFNLRGETVLPANPFGNGRVSRFGYRPNQVQSPILYALGEGLSCGGLFIDETRPLMWSLAGQPWTVSTAGPLGPEETFRFFVITGPDLPALRENFMALTGRPPVPPKNILGVWASGVAGHTLTDWRDRLGTLKNLVPNLSGLTTSGGDLGTLLDLAKGYNLRLLLDESAYVDQADPLYPEMARRSFLVRRGGPGGPPLDVDLGARKCGLVDYTNPSAPTFWHSLFRSAEIESGVTAFRLVDGDLEDVSPNAWYEGAPGTASHSHYAWANRYALKWLEGIEAGLRNQRLRTRPRLFLVSRTGLAGLPRLSGALYNGESFLFGTRSLLAIKAHLALSGFDYYSSDLTNSLATRPVEQSGASYDAWLAKSALTDYPLILPEELLLRPAARYNLTLRENLSPYSYSLTWEAFLAGRPVLAPLTYYFQGDLKARDRMGELMLGPSLLLGLDLDGISERAEVYVPQGRWYNWRTGEVIDQKEGGPVIMDLKDAGQVTPPVLARSGAIVPALEELILKGGVVEKIAALKIFIGQEPSDFTWYEDDGETQNYLGGRFGKTHITAVTKADGSTVVTIKAREGSWDGAPAERRLLIDIYGPQPPGEATLDNMPHNRVARAADLDPMESGWASFGNNRIRFKTPPLDMTVDHVLWFK